MNLPAHGKYIINASFCPRSVRGQPHSQYLGAHSTPWSYELQRMVDGSMKFDVAVKFNKYLLHTINAQNALHFSW